MTQRILLAFILSLTVSLTSFGAKDQNEEYHVQVIMVNGDTITGYIHYDLKTGLKNMFSKTGSIRQYINISDDLTGEKNRYSAKEVIEYRFLEPTEGYPDGAVFVSEMINSPEVFKPLKYVRGFARELNRRESGSILKWDVWTSTGGRNPVNRLVPAIGVKFKGAPATFMIASNGMFTDWYLQHFLKKNYPELHKAWNDYYFKGKDAKAHRKELLDNPSTALLFYEKFIEDNPPLQSVD